MTNFLDTIFNPVFGPLFHLPPFFTIFIISAVITLLITIVYKYTTDQKKMKQIKDDLQKYQKQMRETKDTAKLMKMQKDALDLNMQYMMASLKSTLYTFIPIIIIFAWLSSHIAYYPLTPNTEFTVDAIFGDGAKGDVTLKSIPELQIDSETQTIENNKATWKLSGAGGPYKLIVTYNTEEYNANILITDQRSYENPETLIKDSKLKKIMVNNKVVHPFGESFNLFGWYPGWLATYFFLSIALSALFRKLFKVY